MSDLWLRLHPAVRSALRVAFSALVVWVVTEGPALLASTDTPLWLQGLLLTVVVPAVRALDPTETSFGVGSPEPYVGKHEGE